MLTTIAVADAPTRYSYEVSLKPRQYLELTDSGAAVVNGDGTVALAVASAWAKDANGKNIQTNYENRAWRARLRDPCDLWPIKTDTNQARLRRIPLHHREVTRCSIVSPWKN